jgi:DHA1 family multidrug resistance protein-like MFS transporter
MFGGILSDFFGYRIAFFCTGITLALAGLVVLKWVDNDRMPQQEKKKKNFSLLPDLRPIAASPILVTIMLVSFGVNSSANVASPMLSLFLKELAMRGSAEPAYIGSSTGIVLGVGAASTAIAAVLVGKFSHRFGFWKTLIFCLSAGALMTLPQAFVTNMVQLTILRALSSFFLGGTAPVINAIIAVSSEKEYQGTIYGVNSSVSSAAAAIGPVIGSASAMISYRAVFIAAATLLGLSAWRTASRARKKSD